MVIAWISLLLGLPLFLFSAEFTATVSQNKVSLGEGFTLTLTLKDTSAKTPPSFEPLKPNFLIHSQQQASTMRMSDRRVSSSTTWTLGLIPQGVGNVPIPAISIETPEGKLLTQPIAIEVTREKSQNKEDPLRLETEVSNPSPYKNEPFFLTVRLTSKQTLTNIHLEKFEVEGAIVENAGEPKKREKSEQGVKVGIMELTYLVIPLKPGSLKIPPITIQGGIAQPNSSAADDFLNPFALIQGFAHVQPFAVTTKELMVEIRPPVGGLTPWLPAQAFDIQENGEDPLVFREEDAFTRSFVLSAEGIPSSQLPSLEAYQSSNDQFRVYADKPELKDKIIEGKLKSYRIERYTLIPQQAGDLTLPEISIAWWDVKKDQKRIAHLPGRSVRVLPALDSTAAPSEEKKQIESLIVNPPSWIYAVIGALVLLLGIAVVWLIFLQKKMNRLLKAPAKNEQKPVIKRASSPRRKRETLGDLNPT